MDDKLISVIVPIYNVEDYLEKCIESIINQTYKNLEIILVDDGSTDNCGIICEKYKKIDDRIIVIHKKNAGLSSARNAGLDISTGCLIGFVDGDDYIELTMYEELKKNMDFYNSDISICNFYHINNNCFKKNMIFEKEKFVSAGKEKFMNIQNEYWNVTIVAWNKLYKRFLFKDIRYPNNMIYEDSYIICDLVDKSKRISYLSIPLYNYVVRTNSITNSFSIKHFESIYSFDKRIRFFEECGYYDLAIETNKRKMEVLINNLTKMKMYKIKDKHIWKKYYNILIDTNNKVKWKKSNKKVKLFKIFRRMSFRILADYYRFIEYKNK